MESTRVTPNLLAACLLIIACTPPETAAPAVTVHDSAGIRIVENRVEFETLPEWRPAEPDVRIGLLEGEPEYQLHEVRDATRLPDGRLVVVNRGSHEVRVYGRDGAHLASFGGEGGGPENLTRPRAVLAEGDSLFVLSRGSVSTWSAGGEFRSLRSLEVGGGYIAAWRAGGGLALWLSETVIPRVEGGTARHPVTIRVGSDTLARYAGTRFVRVPSERGIRLRTVHLYTEPQMDSYGDRVFGASGEERAVDVWSADGTRLASIRWDGPPLEVEPGDFEAYREEAFTEAEAEGYLEMLRDGFDDVPVAETFPALSALHAATDGSLWVRRYDRPGDPEGQRWLVFDSDGRLARRAWLPADTELLEVGPEHIVLLERDELDVESVAVYPKSGSL